MLKLRLDSLEPNLGPDDGIRQQLAECSRLAAETIREVRTISYALYPPMLEEAGLKSAIPWFLHGFMERSGVTTKLDIADDFPRQPREVELAIFRVLQESLTNVIRHSGSRAANIRVSMQGEVVKLEIADQGKGISPLVLEALNRGSLGELGIGLRGMRERIRQLGGALEVSSISGETIVRASVPCGKT